MYALNIIVAEHDPAVAASLAKLLDRHFRSVKLACSLEELKNAIPRQHPDAVIADLETVDLRGVTEISRSFHVPVLCTHRVPDDDLWTAAMEAGALDVCPNSDTRAIVSALERNLRASSAA